MSAPPFQGGANVLHLALGRGKCPGGGANVWGRKMSVLGDANAGIHWRNGEQFVLAVISAISHLIQF